LEILSFLWEKWFTFRNDNFGMWQFGRSFQKEKCSKLNVLPPCQIPSKSKYSKSLEFKINWIWLNLILWILIQILFQILKQFSEEICSLFNNIHAHILCKKIWATEVHLWPVQIRISLKFIWINKKRYYAALGPLISLPFSLLHATGASRCCAPLAPGSRFPPRAPPSPAPIRAPAGLLSLNRGCLSTPPTRVRLLGHWKLIAGHLNYLLTDELLRSDRATMGSRARWAPSSTPPQNGFTPTSSPSC
jgi:hypothetical protein